MIGFMQIERVELIKFYNNKGMLDRYDFALQKNDILRHHPWVAQFKDTHLSDMDWVVYWALNYQMLYQHHCIYTNYFFMEDYNHGI